MDKPSKISENFKLAILAVRDVHGRAIVITMEPLFTGHRRDKGKCPLNRAA